MKIWQEFGALIVAALVALMGPTSFVSAQEVPSLRVYGELPAVERVVISQSGKRVGAVTTLGGARMILIIDDENKPRGKFEIGDNKLRSMDFVTDDRLLFVISATKDLGIGFVQDKVELFQAMILDLSTGKIERVFDDRRDVLNAVFGSYGLRIIDGRPKAYYGAVELMRGTDRRFVFNHGRPALYEVDLLTNKSKRVMYSAKEGMDRDWFVAPDGSVLAQMDVSDQSGRWKIRNSQGHVVAEGQNTGGRVNLVTIGKDGDTVIYAERDGLAGRDSWYEVGLDGSSGPREVMSDVDVERLFREPGTGRLIGYLKEDDGLEPVFFDDNLTKKVRAVRKAFGTLNNRMIDWTPDFGVVVVRTDGNGDSGTYYRVDLAQRRADPLAYAYPTIEPGQVGPISTFVYAAGDGLEMDGILTLPPGREPTMLPLVMLPHGGPHSADVEGFDWWAQAFASRGYAVFQPNFRGSTNRDQEFVRAGYGEWGGKMQSDVSDGMAALAAEGIIDPSRACIVGASYGGYAALAGVTLQQGLYRCAVSVAGVADVSLMSRIDRRESGDSKTMVRSLETQLGPKSRYRDISPRYHAEKADAPILLIHGRDDTVVQFSQSLKMADALKDADKPYEFLELEGEDHWLSKAETRHAMLEAAVGFVERHNPAE